MLKTVKYSNHLTVFSNIHFDENHFCGTPYVLLIACKTKIHPNWDDYTIGIAIHDDCEFNKGLYYTTTKENFTQILRELINWMVDHEKGISSYHTLITNKYAFFPDLGCNRKNW